MTRTSAIGYLSELTVAPITSTIRNIPSEALLTKEDGMSKECAVNLDHVQTVSKSKIGAKITELAPGKAYLVNRQANKSDWRIDPNGSTLCVRLSSR